jgi:hypothetical protein
MRGTVCAMLLERLDVDPRELARRTGWEINPEGACKADRCVPMPEPPGANVDVRVVAERLGMALVHDEQHGIWALGPESGGHTLLSAEFPEIELPDRDGRPFSLHSLRGTKVLLVAWASW